MGRVYIPGKTVTGVDAGRNMKSILNNRFRGSKVRGDRVLDFDMANRQLTDKGFLEFIKDLQNVIKGEDKDSPGVVKLQELHLQGNKLTVRFLSMLGYVIALSCRDLKEIDLSNNEIRIVYSQEMRIWEDFLKCFSQCCVLKKVNFGNNPLGARGVEGICRVFIQSELDFIKITATPDEGTTSNATGTSSTDTGAQSPCPEKKLHQLKGTKPSSSKPPADTDIERYSCTRGLQSVPYIIISNVDMENVSIVHLSEMLKMRRTPEQLLAFLPGGKSLSLPDPNDSFKGIYWLPNERVHQDARRVIDKIAQMDDESDDEVDETIEGLTLEDNEDYQSLLERRQARKKKKENLERSESQYRIRVLTADDGLKHSDLWLSSLQMLKLARAIMLDDGNRPTLTEAQLQVSRKRMAAQHGGIVEIPRARYDPYEARHPPAPPGVMISSLRFDPESSTFDFMFPAIHLPSSNPVPQLYPPDISRVLPTYPLPPAYPSNPPAKKPPNQLENKDKASAGSNGSAAHPLPKVFADKRYRSKYRFGLPLHIWRRIIDDAGDFAIIPRGHQEKIVDYAGDWHGLEEQIKVNGATEGEQIWRLLENMKCFTYTPVQ
ncbi:hypothetical protein BGW36DRAFT_423964 [Talaromyces proteolyticus]|uniref:Leucine rich repeat protein n=1 Tax=Talaromyces proteolyticus TaxID=1131652 RepID=A0AAD4Q3D3_9EURO|nr:uncharacterized protein BGW36DRAFT_423964 [Talaromyces proteolyticus]KAH8701661.1 hypothetical protein BGW36DRAFT_423964 [Talaromyces proteolyticus]